MCHFVKNSLTALLPLVLALNTSCSGESPTAPANGGGVGGGEWMIEQQGEPRLRAVWGSAADNVFAVGESGAIRHFDGSIWKTMDSGTVNQLHDISGTSAFTIFAVGSDGAALQYDGTQWRSIAPEGGSLGHLSGVWAAAPNSVYAVGFDNGTGNIYRFNSAKWSLLRTLPRAPTSVWASPDGDVFVVGSGGTISHFDGATWSDLESNTIQTLFDVWGSSRTNVYACGSLGTLIHYDGNVWSPVSEVSTINTLLEVWGTSASDVFVLGRGEVVLHYDGNTWSSETIPEMTNGQGLWSEVGGAAFAVGNTWTNRRDGTSWRPMKTSVTIETLRGVWGARPQDIYAVGAKGRIFHRRGSTWSDLDIGLAPTHKMEAIYGVNADRAYGVEQNWLWQFDGGGWSRLPAVSGDWFVDLWVPTQTDVYTIDEVQSIRHFDGSEWSQLAPTTVIGDLRGIWGTSGEDIYVCGDQGFLAQYDGNRWLPLDTQTDVTLVAIDGTTDGEFFVVGDNGVIIHQDRSGQIGLSEPAPQKDLRDVCVLGARHVIAVGEDGSALRFDGDSWQQMPIPTTKDLWAVWGASNGSAIAVGARGTILRLQP